MPKYYLQTTHYKQNTCKHLPLLSYHRTLDILCRYGHHCGMLFACLVIPPPNRAGTILYGITLLCQSAPLLRMVAGCPHTGFAPPEVNAPLWSYWSHCRQLVMVFAGIVIDISFPLIPHKNQTTHLFPQYLVTGSALTLQPVSNLP